MDDAFYMTYSRSRPQYIVPWVEENDVPLLTNASQRWSERTESFKDMWEYDVPHAIDAGGYNVLHSHGEYPYSVDEYHNWLEQHRDEVAWATVMDYACEERFDDIFTVEERMNKTVENTVEQFSLNPSYKLLPVLQGRSIWNYIESYFDLEIEDIPLNEVGIGTVCRVASEDQIRHISQQLPQYIDVDYMHGFGVKVNSFDRGAEFNSADSAAWTYAQANAYTYELERDDDTLAFRYGDDYGNRSRMIVHSFQSYYAYVTNLMFGEPRCDADAIIERQSWSNEEYDAYLERLRKQ